MTREEFLDKCIAFSVKINKVRKYLRENQHEYNNSDQIQRSGTSIGANYSEACNAESKADFIVVPLRRMPLLPFRRENAPG